MSDFTLRRVTIVTLRGAALAALLAAASLVPIQAARAQAPDGMLMRGANGAISKARLIKHESVEDRITRLHAALQIVSAEETQWSDVAQTMRDNEAAIEKLAAAKHTTAPENVTAVDDLKAYQTFAQAHVDGLTKLIASFEKLYAAMPDEQKKVADQVFATFGQHAAHGHG